jgi:hypothetical protein
VREHIHGHADREQHAQPHPSLLPAPPWIRRFITVKSDQVPSALTTTVSAADSSAPPAPLAAPAVILVPTRTTSPPCPAPCAITPSVCPLWCAWVVNASAVQASRTTSPMMTTTFPRLVPPPPLIRCKSYFHHKTIICFFTYLSQLQRGKLLPTYQVSREDVMCSETATVASRMLFPFPTESRARFLYWTVPPRTLSTQR